MKTGLACLAGTAVSGEALHALTKKDRRKSVSRTSLKSLRAFPTLCGMCPAGCGVLAYLDGDRCIQIQGNPDHPVNHGRICAKGIAGLNLVHDPERLLFPMRRIGKRGGNRWTRITWDEAYQMIVPGISRKKEAGLARNVVWDLGREDPLFFRFIEALEGSIVINRSGLRDLNLKTATHMTTGVPELIPDIARSRTILNFGANPYAQHDLFLGLASRLVEARLDHGAKLYTFDIRMSETAAKSDRWIPIMAGTDGLVALAMAHVIVNNDLADVDFINRTTNIGLPELKRHLSPYSPQRAEQTSGIRAEDIEGLAKVFAIQRPSLALAGGGAADHANGIQNIRCILLLNWLVGSLEQEGGLYHSRSPLPLSTLFSGPDGQEPLRGIGDLAESNRVIDFYFACLSNPAFSEPGCRTVQAFLQDENRVRFSAVMDTHMSETSMLADLVLPAATYLESWGLEYSPSFDQLSILNLRQPVVSLMSAARVLRSPDFESGKLIEPQFRPKGEAKEIGNFCIEMARHLGGDLAGSLPFENTFDYISQEIAGGSNRISQSGKHALKKDGLWIDKPPPKGYPNIQIITDKKPIDGMSRLPDFQPIDSHLNINKEQFILIPYKSHFSSHGTANSKWLREIEHRNPLWINRGAAKIRGIKNGDRIRLTSPSGTLVTQALVTERIHPGSVALAEGFGHTATGHIARGKKSKSKDRDTQLVWWARKGNGININEIVEATQHAKNKSYVSKDTIVTIEKI